MAVVFCDHYDSVSLSHRACVRDVYYLVASLYLMWCVLWQLWLNFGCRGWEKLFHCALVCHGKNNVVCCLVTCQSRPHFDTWTSTMLHSASDR